MASDPARYGTQEKLAEATGLDQKSWSNYLRGECLPSRLARAEIERRLNIAPDLWSQSADAPEAPQLPLTTHTASDFTVDTVADALARTGLDAGETDIADTLVDPPRARHPVTRAA